MAEMTDASVSEQAQRFRDAYESVRAQVARVIVGQREIVDGVLTCLFVGGHALLEGVPGLGKTLLIRTLADALSLKFSRVQFTPDLMPADITGTNVILDTARSDTAGRTSGGTSGGGGFTFQPGPIFAQIVLADEINRATPKTQSAMLEAMQERSVTVGGVTHPMAEPFFVMATQNPIEQEGTYPLPEAQLDRFFFKLLVGYASRDDLHEIIDRTTAGASPKAEPMLDGPTIVEFQQLIRRVIIAPHVKDYAIRCVLATHPSGEFATAMVKQYVRFGASPRAAQALVLGAKVRALLDGRAHVAVEDIRSVLLPAMRHRVLLNFEAQAEGVTEDRVLEDVMEQISATAS